MNPDNRVSVIAIQQHAARAATDANGWRFYLVQRVLMGVISSRLSDLMGRSEKGGKRDQFFTGF
ncbi:MAG TPA: hypothetical protein PLB97_00460, partial [Accumulibacter sp.]|nr:hypothetical protein [Accumulibacter sp.]